MFLLMEREDKSEVKTGTSSSAPDTEGAGSLRVQLRSERRGLHSCWRWRVQGAWERGGAWGVRGTVRGSAPPHCERPIWPNSALGSRGWRNCLASNYQGQKTTKKGTLHRRVCISFVLNLPVYSGYLFVIFVAKPKPKAEPSALLLWLVFRFPIFSHDSLPSPLLLSHLPEPNLKQAGTI